MFTEEEIRFFIKNAGRLGEWQPKIGDYCQILGKRIVLIVQRYGDGWLLFTTGDRHREYSATKLAFKEGKIIPLFILKQLLDRLKEEGYSPMVCHWPSAHEEFEWWAQAMDEGGNIVADERGPTPIIAAAKALLSLRDPEGEVRKEE